MHVAPIPLAPFAGPLCPADLRALAARLDRLATVLAPKQPTASPSRRLSPRRSTTS